MKGIEFFMVTPGGEEVLLAAFKEDEAIYRHVTTTLELPRILSCDDLADALEEGHEDDTDFYQVGESLDMLGGLAVIERKCGGGVRLGVRESVA